MLDGYHILTLTHRQSTLETIGKIVVEGADIAQLHDLKKRFDWQEMLYLATCNRVVFLFYTTTPLSESIANEVVSQINPRLSADEISDISAQMQLLHGTDAIRHWLEVAASMDSLVLGEREIIRQLREAYERNQSAGLTGDHLRLLMRFTIETAKEIYSQTAIGQKAISVVALAFGEMLKALGDRNSRILLVGAGQTNALFSKFLVKYGFNNITVFNRTIEKAALLAETFKGRALPLDALQHYTEGFDALIVCTSATQALITPEVYRHLLQGETTKKVLVDLSVPNNADKNIRSEFPVHFIEIEDLKQVANENLAFREGEREKASALITESLQKYRHHWHERQVERSMSHVPDEVRAVKERAVKEVFGKEFAALDDKTQALVLDMLGYMEKKCVAIPMKIVKGIVLSRLSSERTTRRSEHSSK